ncbi:YicC/YloC family endoribonuclease [Petroclostridium sp. X23]|uniref:YicC/YloC family endoribonuclease n=1 Tax=Petroclostridium sp. X23 TaxID=3045146 RepID=UPI0024AC8D47|nr:YicC/YloC family endoribonuclease [Petroclostridium sp. X23]WHH59906.1 YicC/YloC family endoribonuclease [Petroclostridium sp. X23]
MIKSMTGFGRSEAVVGSKEVLIEMKSVNHRYADFSIRVPRNYSFLEDKVREYLQKYISRGKVDVFLTIESQEDDDKQVVLNEALASGYIHALRQMKDAFGLQDDISACNVARFNDILKLERKEEDQDALWATVQAALEPAVQDFIAMREREGLRLSEDLIERGKYIASQLDEIEVRSPQVVEEYRNKIKQRIEEYLNNVAIDENRLLTEVAIFSDRTSITEEIVRLRSHLVELGEILKSGQAVGRKLDFLVQEMNREINTIGSKANDLYISKRVVEIKAEIEKCREQIQNIE